MHMFDSLRKKLREGVEKLSGKAEEEVPKPSQKDGSADVWEPGARGPGPASGASREERAETERSGDEKPVAGGAGPERARPGGAAKEDEKGRLAKLREKVSTRELTGSDIDSFFEEGEMELLQSDVALEVTDALREKLKEKLAASKVRRGKASGFVREAFRESLLEIVDRGSIDLEGLVKEGRKAGKPPLILFLGYNGSGKTTTLAKLASWFRERGFTPVLAAGDTFRAASIEQLEVHGKRLGLRVIKHQYGSDSAAVIFDARKYAEKNRLDVVIADTAGRQHTDKNLMDELRKVVRVNQPELKVLVVDSLTGNDAVEQARRFHEAVGVDCVVMTKTDVNPRGGSILSVVHTIGKPVLFLGTGQEYMNIEMFSPERFVRELVG